MAPVKHEPTGEFYRITYGSTKGEIGEVVRYTSWGGVDLKLAGGSIATCSMGDVERIEKPRTIEEHDD
jgi:hypothetical protein